MTLCAARPFCLLTRADLAGSIEQELSAMEQDESLRLQAATVRPDHLHALVRLGNRLTLSQVVGRLKAKTRVSLSVAGGKWQGNFFEHRMRPDESAADVFRYMFLNPYRSSLIPLSEKWPWFWLGEEEAAWFVPTTDLALPFPDWLSGPVFR